MSAFNDSDRLFVEIITETRKLILRTMKSSDVSQDYVDWLNDPEINRYLSCAHILHTMESCLDYIHSYEERNDKALIGIFLKDNELHIGNITLSAIDWQKKVGTIGICIGRKRYLGKRLGEEALSGIINCCFEQLGLTRLQAWMHTKNERSVNLFKKCGFRIEKTVQGGRTVDDMPHSDYILAMSAADRNLQWQKSR